MKKPISKKCTCHDCLTLIIEMTDVLSARIDNLSNRIELINGQLKINLDNFTKQSAFDNEITECVDLLSKRIDAVQALAEYYGKSN